MLVGLQVGTTTMGNNLAILQKIEIVLPEEPAQLIWAYIQNMPHHSTETCAPLCSLTCNRQKLEITQMSLNRRVETENVVSLHNGILFSY